MLSRKIYGAWPLAAVLLASLVVDLSPRFHLGDSTTFLSTNFPGFLPVDRSWTYGLAVHWLGSRTHLLASTSVVQIVLSWAAYAFFGFILTKALGLGRRAVVAVIAVGTLEPLGFYWARSFMSDSPAQSAFVFLCGVLLLRCGAVLRFGLVFIAGFVLLSLRTVYFPAVLLALLAAWAWTAWRDRTGGSGEAWRWGVAAAAFLCANIGYAALNTVETHSRVFAANVGDAEYLAAALSPLGGDRFTSTPLTPADRGALAPLTYENRNAQLWSPNGLVPLIRAHYGQGYRATEAARPAMQHFVIDVATHHPIRLAALVLRQWGDYLNPGKVISYHARGWWSGSVAHQQSTELPDEVMRIFRQWRIRPMPDRDLPAKPSFALSYYETVGGVWSLILALFATLSPLMAISVPSARRSGFLVFSAAFSLLYMASVALAADELVTRYLLPMTAPLIYTAAVSILVLGRSGRFIAQLQSAAQL